MIRKNVVAIGEVLFRVGWTSKLVAIYPLEEVLDKEEGTQRLPPGLMVVPLPFEDDVREPELDEAMKELRLQSTMEEGLAKKGVKLEDGGAAPDLASSLSTSPNLLENTPTGYVASEELVQAAMDLIEKQTVDDDIQLGEDLENAALQRFFDYIEAIAMEDPFFEARTDFDTEVPDEDVLKAAGKQIDQFKVLLPDDVDKPKAAGRKRKIVEDDSGINWVELYQEGELDSCKLPELKKYLRSIGEQLSGKKSDLVVRVQEHIQKSLKTSKVKMEI
jgi:ATP-dependent DNA helicase 2 subunit 1